ncbi:hypothetical protein [Tabrizicola sp.]|uniref:hypothetical protein n=1 Tax=Tabrizicola sp. TaxID=2005166 RepID=UPI00286C584A|nr:hypothetical protein [Tabrizicola sp.]
MTTLSIAPQDFWSLVAVMALIATCAGIYAILALQGRPYHAPIWEQLSLGGVTLVTVLGLVWIGMFGLTVLAAYLGLWQSIHPDTATTVPGQPTFGLGALVAALLGAPFLIWGTWLKYQTVRYQKEGHITDRINKAVEMLGAEKVVKKHVVDLAGAKVFEKDAHGKPDTSKPVFSEESAPNIEVRIGAILSLERIAQD